MKWPSFVPLTPYEEIIAGIPEDDFVEIEGQRVYAPVRGEGPAVVLLHGFAADSFFYRDLLPLLEKQYRVILIDLNGFGLTERPGDPEEYSLRHQADVIVRVTKERGCQSFHLVGHSYGSGIAATVALSNPELIDSLVLMAPAWEIKRPPWYLRNRLSAESLHVAARAMLSSPERFRKATSMAFHVEHPEADAVAEWYRRHILVEGFREALFGYARAMGSGRIQEIDFSSLKPKTMILAGREDRLVTLASCKKLAEKIPGVRFEVIDECGHSLPEEKPKEVAQLLREFFSETQ